MSNDFNEELQYCAASSTTGGGWLGVSTQPLSFFYFDENDSANHVAYYANFGAATQPYFTQNHNVLFQGSEVWVLMQTASTNIEIFHLSSLGAANIQRQTMTVSSNPLISNGIALFSSKIFVGVSNCNTLTKKALGYFELNSATLAFANYRSFALGNYNMISTNLFVLGADEIFTDYQDSLHPNHGFIRFRPVSN